MIYFALILINILLIIVLHNISFKIKLIDYPSERKLHSDPTPLIGGISIYLTMLIGSYLVEIDLNILLILNLALVVVFIGVLDDFLNVDFKIRFLCQFIVCIIIISKGIYIVDLSFISTSSNQYIIFFLIPFTILSVIGLTNAFNFIDGVDGLSSILFIKSIILLIFFIKYNNTSYDISFLYLVIISIVPFVLFNLGIFKGYKIFLGDSGSTFLGFLLSWLLIYYSQIEKNIIDPIIIIWIAPIVVYDFFAVFIYRMMKRSSPFSPDNMHLHFILLKRFNKNKVLFFMITTSMLISLIGSVTYFFVDTYISLLLFFILFFLYLFINNKLRIN